MLCVLPLSSLGRTLRVTTYAELRAACLRAEPGDTIVVAAGVYTIEGATRIPITDRPGPVTVRGETGKADDVTIRGKGQDDEAVAVAFDLSDSPHWTFRDLTTRDTYDHGFKFNGGSTDCALVDVTMRDHGEGGVKGTWNPQRYPDRLLVERCDIGFSPGRGGTRPVVEGIDGVAVQGWVVRDTRFVNVVKPGGDAYGVFTKGNAADTIIEGCRFESCDVGASFGGGGTDPRFFRDGERTFEHRGGSIRNNVFVRCRDAGIYVNKGARCRIENNTLFECALGIQLRYPESSGWVQNNLVKPSPKNRDEPLLRRRDGASTLIDAANLKARNEDFVRPEGEDSAVDLHLRHGSGAIDAGVRGVLSDKDGARRPQGKATDVGAYEAIG